MAEERVQRRLAAIVVADVVGYSRLMGEDEVGTLDRLKKLRAEFLHPKAEEYGGRIVKTTGDGTIIEFGSAVDAVSHAVDVQRGMSTRNASLPDNHQIHLRLGINVGDIIIDDDDIFGDGVNVAARLEALAETGGICISDRVHDYVRGRLEIGFDDLGEQTVKNIAEPVRIFRVRLDDGEPDSSGDRPGAQADADKPSIAVLPFDNLSADPEQEYFSDGMAEDLITDLSKISNLSVAARNSSFSFKGQMPDVKEVAGKLGVAVVLEGSVRKMGDRLRINAQLIDAADGKHVWAERYDGEMDEIFDFQDRILSEIVSALELTLTPADVARAERKRTDSVEAYDLFLKGRTRYFRYAPDDNLEAGRLLEQAIEADPNFAEVYTYLAMCYVNARCFLWPGFEKGLARAEEIARTAVEIAPELAIVHLRLGWVELFQRKHDAARVNFERALSLEPENAELHAYFGEAMNFSGEFELANEHAATALRLDPLSPPSWVFIHGRSFYHLGQYDKAASMIGQAVERVPAFTFARLFLACTYVEMDRLDEAKEQIRHLVENEPRYTVEVADRAG